MTKKILVLGNSHYINDIDFNKLNTGIETFGVNRIWLKHFPTYYFFHDNEILRELDNNIVIKSKLIAKSTCFSSDWLTKSTNNLPHWVRRYPRQSRRKFPDSVTTGLHILGSNILPGKISDYTFYLAGISLKWQEPSHFWKESNHISLNNKDKDWYDIRFNKMFENFRDLRAMGYNMISVTPDSNLNKLMIFQNIENLYV